MLPTRWPFGFYGFLNALALEAFVAALLKEIFSQATECTTEQIAAA